jgi:hypothetical protein
MKVGCAYALVSVIAFAVLFALIVPFFLHNAPPDAAEKAGRFAGRYLFLPVAMLGFWVGYKKEKKAASSKGREKNQE